MPIQVEQSVDEPIVTFIFSGSIDTTDVQAANDRAALLLQQMGTYYAIIDVQGAEIAGTEALASLRGQDTSAPLSDPRITPILLNKANHDEPAQQALPPGFTNREQALEYIRQTISHRASDDTL